TSAPYQKWITYLSISLSIRAFLALYDAGSSGIWSALPLVSQRLCRQRRRLATGSRRGDREAALSPTTPRPPNRAPDEIGPGPPMSAPSAATASRPARARERHEQILDRNRPGDEVLLDHVGDQRLQRRPVGFDAVGKRISPEDRVDLLHVIDQPRQHGAQRAGVAHAHARAALRLHERVVEAARDPALALVQVAADDHEVHDRKDPRLLVELAFQGAIVRKQPGDVGVAPELVGLARSDQRVDRPARE